MNFEINTDEIVDKVVSEALERKIDGKTIKQWMAEIAKHQWISVKERLPEEEYACLAVTEGRALPSCAAPTYYIMKGESLILLRQSWI